MDAETKYNIASCLVVISIITSVTSIVSVFMAYPIKPCTCSPIDANSVTTTILSILVTVLIGWNIYTVIDFNKIITKIEERSKELLPQITDAEKRYFILEKEIDKLKADITFGNVYNYARRMEYLNVVSYAIDGYIDALNVAITDKLQSDRVEICITAIQNIIDRNNGIVNILPDTKNTYYDIIMSIKPQSDSTRKIGIYLHETATEKLENFPDGELRVISDYH